jgi:hypothetical protein
MRSNAFVPPVIKDRDTYLMAASQNFSKMYRLSLDGLAATIDYYTKYQKALNTEEVKDRNAERLEEAKKWLEENESVKDEDSFHKRYYNEHHRRE